jgi:alpha-glucosidase
VYSANRPESHAVFRDWRKIAESYPVPRLLLGETWVGDLGSLAAFHGNGDELQLTFNFPFIFTSFTAEGLAAVVAETLAELPAGECPVWTASNHDISRFPTRWCAGDERKARLALLVLATLPGTLVLYYGDEIAMTDVDVPPALVRDKMRAEAGSGESRDRARTPMPWDASPSAGFTAAGVTPWLPYGEHARRNVAAQRADPSSTLHLCRDLLALRRAELSGRLASYTQLPSPPGLWVYQAGGLTVLANFTGSPVRLSAPLAELGEVLISSDPAGAGDGSVLGPWSGIAVRAEPAR